MGIIASIASVLGPTLGLICAWLFAIFGIIRSLPLAFSAPTRGTRRAARVMCAIFIAIFFGANYAPITSAIIGFIPSIASKVVRARSRSIYRVALPAQQNERVMRDR